MAVSEVVERASAAIAEGIHSGDKHAERELIARFRPGVVLMLQRRLANRWLAEDIANDALSEALRILRARRLEQPHGLAAFIHGIAANLARNANRKTARQRTDVDTDAVETALDASHDPAIINMRASLAQAVRSVLDSLPVPRDREILVRLYLQEEDKEDICRDLCLSSEHFDRVLHRARKRMREHIDEMRPRLTLKDFTVLL